MVLIALLSIHAVLREPLLLGYTKYGCRWRLRLQIRPLAMLDMSAGAFEGGFCVYPIIAKF